MIAKGVHPGRYELTPFNPMPEEVANPGDFVRPWESLNADEKKLFSRLAEVYAGFSEYTDAQIGRIIDYLEQSGQLDNTVVVYAADNGASGEGSPNGSVNENKFFNGYPDELSENMKLIDVLGGPDTYEHFPDRLGRRILGAVQDVQAILGICRRHMRPAGDLWPKGIKARGEVRDQYHHCTDIVPTILDICGLEMPKVYKGVEQTPLSGVSMRYTFDATRTRRRESSVSTTRCSEAAASGKTAGRRAPSTRRCPGRATSTRMSGSSTTSMSTARNPTIWRRSTPKSSRRWSRPGSRKRKRTSCCRSTIAPPWNCWPSSGLSEEAPRERYIYYPGTAPVPEGVAVNTRGRSYKIIANVEIADPDCSGVIFAHGSRFGGHALFIKDRKLHYVYNFLGIKPEQTFVSSELKPGKYTLGMEFIRERAGEHDESLGKTTLYVNEAVARAAR